MSVIASVELTPGRQELVGGTLKLVRAPVVVLVNPVRDEHSVSCDWLCTHPGLEPGAYPLTNGVTVDIPSSLCSMDGRVAHSITLEVTRE